MPRLRPSCAAVEFWKKAGAVGGEASALDTVDPNEADDTPPPSVKAVPLLVDMLDDPTPTSVDC